MSEQPPVTVSGTIDAVDIPPCIRRSGSAYGTVRAVVLADGHAMVLDDLNSDGEEVELSMYGVGDGWTFRFDRDDVGFPAPGTSGDVASGGSLGFDGEHYDWAAGREPPRTTVTVRWQDEDHQVAADGDGWWLFVRRTTEADAGRIRRAW